MKTAGKIAVLIGIILVVSVGFFVYLNRCSPVAKVSAQPMEITGSIEVKTTDVNVKVPGKVLAIMVEEGQEVQAGDIIAKLEADSIEAKADLTQAMIEAATAQYQKAKNGARPQQLEQTKNLVAQAKAGYELAKITYERLNGLFKQGVLARQKLDMARTELEVSQARYESAQEQLDLVKEGAQKEDIAAANALVKQAEAARAEVQTYLNDTDIKAPLSGMVTMKAVEAGELVSTGMPLVTISNLKDAWVEMRVRETAVHQFNLGQTVPVKVVGVPRQVYQGKVTYIAAKPSFATERAYQERGEKDMVAFAVKIKLQNNDLKIKPGMTAVISL
ncbi:MAG: efflux RND transporter periplasmic adaptor subunit [Bacillota bacterium]|jgi:HlyD family secretion protein